jgi:HlyD family secretion protein
MIAHKERVLKIPNAVLRYRPESGKVAASEEVGKRDERSQKRETSGEKGTGGQQRSGMTVERVTEGLNLTVEQQEKAAMIVKASQQEIQEIREKSKPEEARGKIQSLLRQKIMGLLTEEQRQKWKNQQSDRTEERKQARIWVLSSAGQPAPVSIVLGITDGTFSEVVSGDLKEGTELIVEETSKKKNQSTNTSRPPFFPGMRK